MLKTPTTILVAAVLSATSAGPVAASPSEDREDFRAYYQERFPDTPMDDYVNGVYAIDQGSRDQWEQIEEFPPYELAVQQGEELFNTPFANGKGYADCFDNGGMGVRQHYPKFDAASGKIITLEQAINDCRTRNDEQPLPWKKGDIAALSAYMAYTSRGEEFDVSVPDDPRAQAAYEQGKQAFYAKRGQLNLACADCHQWNAGNRVRADILSPALGHVSHFPVYRSKWGELGTLHRRFGGCNEQVRAAAHPPQSDEYKALEYYLTVMSQGLEVNGPGARK